MSTSDTHSPSYESLLEERNKWKKIAHDLYMAAAHINNCKPCRNRSIPAMYNYEEANND
jgi:recombinational DNA repair protein RecR